MFELVDDESKSLCATIINSNDILTFGYIGLTLMFLTPNLQGLVEVMFMVHTVLVLIYILLAPESPRWLLINNKREEAISVLNYIGRFNCSKNRIDERAEFDLIGQAIRQSKTLTQTNEGWLKSYETASIMNLVSHV